MPSRAFCRACDRAVEARGAWPGRCAECGTPVEAAPLPDVVRPGLRLLLVGINPSVMSARTRHHYANPRNAFWACLHEGGLTPRRFAPREQDELDTLGIGLTNVVPRATPGSADVTREDVERGRERLRRLVERVRPEWLAFVGKQAYTMATGAARPPLGTQREALWGARAFVLPSTSPANAAVPRAEKVRAFAALRKALDAR